MVLADCQLRGRADHPLGRTAVRLARADLDAAWQRRAGRRERHEVADGEVDRAADDLMLGPGTGRHPAVPDRLPVPGKLLDLPHLRHHDTADVVPDRLDRLDLKAGRGEPPGDLGGHGTGQACLGQADAGLAVGGLKRRELEQPGQRDPHHASIPNARLNRTSPSTVSLMSVTPREIISVRSMPSPKAKPL